MMVEKSETTTEELPEIEDIDHSPVEDPLRVTVQFENGAKLRYKQTHDGKVEEQVFAPSDPDSAMETSVVAHTEATVADVAYTSLDMYDDYDTVNGLKTDWTNLAEWITHN